MLRYLVLAFCARLADEGMAVAVVLLAAFRSGSAAQGAFVMTAWMAPHVLAAPLTGALAARTRRPRLFHAGALAGFALAIGVLALGIERAPLPLVLAVAAAGGCCGPVVSGGLSGLVTRLFPAGPARERAQAWDAVSFNAAGVAGPASVGLVSAASSPALAMTLMAAVAASAAALVALLPEPASADTPPPRDRLHRDLAAGLLTVWRQRELLAVTAATSLAFVGDGALTTTSVLYARSLGHASAGGLLMTAFAAGGLAGALATTRLRPGTPSPRLAVVGLLTAGTALAGAALSPALLVATACYALAGAGDALVLTATLRLRAEHSPTARRPQVFTIGAGLKISAAALGSGLAGVGAQGGTATAHWYLTGVAATQILAAALYVLLRRGCFTRHLAPAAQPKTTCPPR